MAAIETRGLSKEFGDVTAVEDLDLEVGEEDVYGFLGPNGAGKSTTINVLLDFVRPTEGEVSVLGMDPRRDGVEVRRRTGVMPEDYGLYGRLSGRKHVEFVARSKDTETGDALERVGLRDAADRRVKGYSTGMRKRLVLAMALVGEPDLLILDEPTSGLDPNGARRVREIVREENERGAAVFFSSHILEQVEAVCNRVAILRDGRLIAQDSVEGLRAGIQGSSRLEITAPGFADKDGLLETEGVEDAVVDGDVVSVWCRGDAKLRALNYVADSVEVRDFKTHETSLDDVFREYTEGER